MMVAAALGGCTAAEGGREPSEGPVTDPCAGVSCVDALPASVDGTTVGAGDELDHYSCDPAADLSGSEIVYRVTVPEDGFLVVAKSPESAAGTVLRLLGSNDPLDCRDGHPTHVAAAVSAGQVFVVVDSAPGAEGDVSLRMALTTTKAFESAGIHADLARDGLTVIQNAWAWGATRRSEYALVDFSLHSSKPREWVFDLSTGELLWNLRVAHGWLSTDGENLGDAVTFSDVSGSNQSSLGLLRSAGTYVGTYGPSFRLEGLEPGFNTNVCDRDIVMHPWAPVGDEYVNRCGYARPSLGCPAIDSLLAQPYRDRLARPADDAPLEEGIPMLFWYPDGDWQEGSVYLHGSAPTDAILAAMSVRCDSTQDGVPMPPASTDYGCD